MINLLWVSILTPLLGALILAIFGSRVTKTTAGIIGCATVGVAFVCAVIIALTWPGSAGDTILYEWMNVGGLVVPIGLHLDALSLVMLLIVSFVGFMIHLYASQSMYDEDGYSRFFCYMNLFIGSMLILVLANNLLLLYLGWEGVGLCSYLLIGFWYKDPANGHAAQKAFIVTRVGDTALAIGLFLIYLRFHTLEIQQILHSAPSVLAAGGVTATAIAFLIIGGAVGKSAQVPLQTWLPDAMAGPTPVSALIHAATMVTAGVYLIARLHVLFEIAPVALAAVAVIGTATLFYSGFSALVQRDIKRMLAYSTISQIGYMFLALGVGAYTAAIFHFVTHAFFKALLFLSAGVVIDAQHHEHDIFKMGGLKDKLPIAYWTFLIGAASLSALPLVTAGFFSKDAIIWAAYWVPVGPKWLWIPALLAAFITAAYSFRVFFLVFYGEQKMEVNRQPRPLMTLSLIVLSFFSITAGYIGWPELMLHFNPFGAFMASVFGSRHFPVNRIAESALLAGSVVACFAGIATSFGYYRHHRWASITEKSTSLTALHRFFYSGWGFDWLYETIFVKPFKAIAYGNRSDFIDSFFAAWATMARWANTILSETQTGRVRSYAAGIVLGAIIMTAIIMLR